MKGKFLKMKKQLTYPVVVETYMTDLGPYYFITSPDIKGSFAQGPSLSLALDVATEAVTPMLLDNAIFQLTEDSKQWPLAENEHIEILTIDLAQWVAIHGKSPWYQHHYFQDVVVWCLRRLAKARHHHTL